MRVENAIMRVEVEGAINTLEPLTKSPVLEATMANRSLPNSLIKIKMCAVPDCDEFAKRSGYCPMHDARLKRGKPLDRPKYHQEHTSKHRLGILSARREGKTLQQIAADVGVSLQRVQQVCKKHGLPKPTWEGRHTKLINDIWKRYLLGVPPRELVGIFQVTPWVVSKCLRVRRQGLTADELRVVTKTVEHNRFWHNADKAANKLGCWIWQGSILPTGYGHISFQGRSDYAHRVAFELHNGYRPTLHVLHSCDNPPCVNPAHLREGTPADNMRDRDRRGRAGWQKDYDGWRQKLREGQRKRTDYNAKRRLSDSQVEEIRRRYAEGESGRALGVEFGCHFGHISRIARGDVRRFDLDGNPMRIYPPSEKVHKLFRDKFAERNA